MVPTPAPMRVPELRLSRTARCIALALAAMAVSGVARAQSMHFRPYVSASATWSDNVGADARGGDGDLSFEVAPGISVLRESGRFRGNLNAAVRNIVYMNETDRNDTFVVLNGHGQVEAVEDTLFVDMDASIDRSNRSVFAGRAAGDPQDFSSDNETRMYGIGPRLKFRLGPDTNGTAKYMTRWVSGGGGLDNRRESTLNAQVANPAQFGRIGWGLEYRRTESDFGRAGLAGSSSEDILRGTLYAKVTPQLRLRGIVGREKNNFDTATDDRSPIVGGGFDWNPTERTTISGTSEKRIFGRGYDFRFNHRHANSTWSLSYVRDVSSSLETVGLDVFQDPEFRLLFDGLERQIADPLLREAVVRRLLGFPSIGARDLFVTNARFVTRSLAGSVSFIGVRNVLTFAVQRSERERLGAAVTGNPVDDFARFDNVTTRAGTVSLSHKLAPQASLNANLTRSRSTGRGRTDSETERTLFSLALLKQLGPHTSGGVTYRYQRAEGASDFVENAIVATISVSF